MAEQSEDQKKIQSLEEQLKNQSALNDTLKKQLATADATTTDLKAHLTAAQAAKAKADADLEQAMGVVTELKAKLADKTSQQNEIATIKVGKDTYELTSEFTYAGQAITLQHLTENPALAEELIREGVGNLRKVVTKTK